jgi:uncharacterized Zn finger protein (UPF0148 family)
MPQGSSFRATLGFATESRWDSIAQALAPGGKGKVFCPDCGKPIHLRDVIEEKFESPAVKEQVREMGRGVHAASPSA